MNLTGLNYDKTGRVFKQLPERRWFGEVKSCLNCGKLVFHKMQAISRGKGHFCSGSCANTGEYGSSWNHGIMRHSGGWVLRYCPEHPNKQKSKHVFQHRLIMEKHINRYLTKKEIVHHINGVKDDNKIENLRLFKSQKEHLRFHRRGY